MGFSKIRLHPVPCQPNSGELRFVDGSFEHEATEWTEKTVRAYGYWANDLDRWYTDGVDNPNNIVGQHTQWIRLRR